MASGPSDEELNAVVDRFILAEAALKKFSSAAEELKSATEIVEEVRAENCGGGRGADAVQCAPGGQAARFGSRCPDRQKDHPPATPHPASQPALWQQPHLGCWLRSTPAPCPCRGPQTAAVQCGAEEEDIQA